jgi:hypothetical protein
VACRCHEVFAMLCMLFPLLWFFPCTWHFALKFTFNQPNLYYVLMPLYSRSIQLICMIYTNKVHVIIHIMHLLLVLCSHFLIHFPLYKCESHQHFPMFISFHSIVIWNYLCH